MDTLIERYINRVETAMEALHKKNFRWSIKDFKLRDPPDVNVIPVIEHLVSKKLQSTDNTVLGIEKEVTGKRSANLEEHQLLARGRKNDAKRTQRFNTLSKPFDEE